MIKSWNFFLLIYGVSIGSLFSKFHVGDASLLLFIIPIWRSEPDLSGISFCVFWENSCGYGVDVVFMVLFIKFQH